MSSWGNNDNAANTPLWAAATVKLAPTSANTGTLFDNTTPNALIVGETIGVFGVSANEAQVDKKGAHTGWVLRTVGSGGRAGRVQEEVLVAMNTINSDAEDTVYKDTIITITSQPATVQTVSAASADTLTYSITAAITDGASVPLSYQWQVNNNTGGTWVNINAGTGVTTGQPGNMTKTGANTATLVLDPTGTTANNYVFRCVVTASGTGATATSANGRILITA